METITDDRGATSFGYDERERLTGITYPNGKTITYSYDAGYYVPVQVSAEIRAAVIAYNAEVDPYDRQCPNGLTPPPKLGFPGPRGL